MTTENFTRRTSDESSHRGYYLGSSDTFDEIYANTTIYENTSGGTYENINSVPKFSNQTNENTRSVIIDNPYYANTQPGYKNNYLEKELSFSGSTRIDNLSTLDDFRRDESTIDANPQLSITRPRPPIFSRRKRQRSTIYDENHYALARISSSGDSYTSGEVSNESGSFSRCTQLKNFIKQKKCYFLTTLCLFITASIVIGIVMALIHSGTLKVVGPPNTTGTMFCIFGIRYSCIKIYLFRGR